MGSFVLMWKKDDRVLTAGNLVVRKDSRLQLRNDFSLEINSLKPEDQGPYVCEIDVMGQAITIDHTVYKFDSKYFMGYLIKNILRIKFTK